MTPEKGPRRHFTHQQFSPTFVGNEYVEGPGGKFERKAEKLLKAFKNNLIRIIRLGKSS